MTADAADNTQCPQCDDAVPTHQSDAAKGCEHCGSWEAQELGGQWLCADCIALAGCSCAGSAAGEE
jgi:hypothetical protein